MSLYLPGHPDQPAPLVTVHAVCSVCRQQAVVGPEYDRDAALDMLDALGWRDLDRWPLCPNCASWPKRAIA